MTRDEEIDDLTKSATDMFRTLLVRAYELGAEAEKRETEILLAERFARINELAKAFQDAAVALHSGTLVPRTVSATGIAEGASEAKSEGRAAAGSIRPAIVAALKANPNLRPSELAVLTGIKENTVRGTLRKMLDDSEVWKANGRWNLRSSQLKHASDAKARMSIRDRIDSIVDSWDKDEAPSGEPEGAS